MVNELNLSGCSHEYEYKQEGALLYYMDLPRKGFEQLYADTEKFMRASNAQHWKLSLTEWEQPLRFNSFTIDGWFPTHVDHNSADNSKLSIIQLMNDDYEGGELYVGTHHIEWRPGDVVIFPAFMPTSIEKVTRGECIVFTAWASGPRFK